MAPGDAPRMRPAHPNGPTFLAYTPNGRRLITVGTNDTIRIFETDSEAEPVNIHDCPDGSTAVVATDDFFVVGSEEGSVSLYSLATNAFDRLLVRCSLPVRALAISPDGQWVAVASDDIEVKIINIKDMTRVQYLREQQKPVKHLSYDPSGRQLTLSCTDGVIYVYSVDGPEPELVRKVDGIVRRVESEDQASSAVVWHPDGRAFASATATREVQVVSKRDWEKQRAFGGQHQGDITSLTWSPNGAMLVTAASDKAMVLWDTKTQKRLEKWDLKAPIWAFAWHPTENILSYTDDSGALYIHTDFLPDHLKRYLSLNLQPAPFIHDTLGEISGNAGRPLADQSRDKPRQDREIPIRRAGTPDSLDEILGPEENGSLDGFIEDDEGGFDHVNNNGKRGYADELNDHPAKRRAAYGSWQPRIHDAFQPGSTPWRGNRRYLCLNLLGFVWTVDQDTHHTVTVEFYDREFQRDFHFTDPYKYDKACLSEKGTLFSCQPTADQPAMIHYRPHETWTTRADWRTSLPKGESIVAIALSHSFIVATTSTNYVRVYTLFGTPIKVYRQKSTPIVTCATWRDYVLTIGNGPVAADGQTRLLYYIENIKRDETCQAEDIVALAPEASLRNVFFSDTGDPCIYDTTGVLLVCQHWRTPGQARWVPLLDTKLLSRLASGRKEESYWPVAVAQERFYCIILKGGDRHPYFPRPLLNEFEFHIPLHHSSVDKTKKNQHRSTRDDEDADMSDAASDDDSGTSETSRLEHSYALTTLLHSLTSDLLTSTTSTAAQRAALASKALEADKLLLQLLAAECVEGEERGMKALEIVGLMRDESGRMMDAAGKVAGRFGREVLRGRIEEMAERRVVGLEGEDGE